MTSSQSSSPGTDVGPGRILFADDDPLLRDVVRSVLERRGHSVECVDNGGDAAKKLAGGEFDLFVTDIDMPGNEDFAVLTRRGEAALEVPVLVLTGHPSIQTAVTALRASAVDYLTKPIRPEQFLDHVTEAIARGRTARRSASTQAIGEQVMALVAATPVSEVAETSRPLADGDRSSLPGLSPSERADLSARESEVLEHLASGSDVRRVGESLHISPFTVRNHLRSIYRKLGVHDRVGLMVKVMGAARGT